MRFNQLAVGISIVILGACSGKTSYQPDISTVASPKGTKVYDADSASIAAHYQIPEWFRDAKFGIFIHWGVYSVPAYGSEWYPRDMYDDTSHVYRHHLAVYGNHTKFGYKDFVPMFKAEKFNANDWATLFKASGAKYVVPVAEHHDGFAMYASSWNKWNSVDMGPQRDIIGELKTAISSQGLYFGVSSHRAENAWFFNQGMKFPSDVQDTSIRLYGERIGKPEGSVMGPDWGGVYQGSNERSRKEWLMHTYELIDKYQPDLIWFDWTVGKYPFQPTFYKFMAYYYNNSIDWGKQVVVNTKFGFGDNIQVFDIERGKSDEIRKFPWQTDTSVGKKSWSYVEGEENKTPDHIINDLVDVVSKNGNVLLNIGPRADGTITEAQRNVLLAIGGWLKVNGDAIYGTRPWVNAGEGSNKGSAGYMTDNQATEYTASDIRFTTKGQTLYAISLAWGEGEITITSLAKAKHKGLTVKNVQMLGSSESIVWEHTNNGLKVKFPSVKPTDYAHVFKIELDGIILGDTNFNSKGETATAWLYNHSAAQQSVTVGYQEPNGILQSKEYSLKSGTLQQVEINVNPYTENQPILSILNQ